MSILLTVTIGISAIFLGKHLFQKWFNHLSLYSVIWVLMITFYELKIIPYIDLTIETWVVIISSFFCFLLGIITLTTARDALGRPKVTFEHSKFHIDIFRDNGRLIRWFIFAFSLIGILSALQHWMVLIDEFGNVMNVLINSFKIYRMRLSGEIKGVVPYLWLFGYFGVALAGIYTAYKNRITFLSLLPLIAVILKESARFTRAGILFALLEFLLSFIFFRHLLSKSETKTFGFNKLKIIPSVIVMAIILFLAASLVKIARNPTESFEGTQSSLTQYEGGILISPSLYFYMSSHLGVLDRYLEKDNENLIFGAQTFFTVYSILQNFNLVDRPDYQSRGYYIPYWSNTATYLRDLHSDFGYLGILLFPFLLGLLTTFFWCRYYENHRIIDLIVMIFLNLIIGFSFFKLIMQLPNWTFGLLIVGISLMFIEKINRNKYSDYSQVREIN
jgi:oligosaccharide repeat unit polymerase